MRLYTACLFAFILAVTTTMFATSARGGGYTINGPFVTALGPLLGSAVALRIADPRTRDGFLRNVEENARTLELARAWVDDGSGVGPAE